MLVDDELIEREGMKLLVKNNFPQIKEINEAENGFKAIELYKRNKPDIVIMDINMPGIDGIETIKELKKLEGNSKFIILTAHSQFKYAQQAIRLGVSDFLLKPTNIKDFKSVVNEVLDTIEKDKKEREKQLQIQSKIDSLINILGTDCIYSLAIRNEKQVLMNLVQLFDGDYKYGFCFIIKTRKEKDITQMIIQKINRLGYFFLGEYIYNLNIFLCLFDKPITSQNIKDISNYIEMILDIYEDGQCSIGIDDTNISLEEIETSYYHALDCVKYGLDHDLSLVMYSNILNEQRQVSFDVIKYTDMMLEMVMLMKKEVVDGVITAFFSELVMLCKDDYKSIQSYVWETITLLRKMTYDNMGKEVIFEGISIEELEHGHNLLEMKQFLKSTILSLIETIEKHKIKNQNKLAVMVHQYIKKHYSNNISLEDLSNHLKISTYYACKIIKKEYNKSFVDLVSEYRIEKAKVMLQDYNISIKEVAYSVGFKSQHYFSKIFKKYTSMTPSDYKKLY